MGVRPGVKAWLAQQAAARAAAARQQVGVCGVASGVGQPRAGVERAPSAIRAAGLIGSLSALGYGVQDLGDTDAIAVRPDARGGRLRNVDAVVEVCRRHQQRLAPAVARGALPVVLGGDHSISIGTWAAMKAAGRNPRLLWVDAHGDFNTPKTSPSGHIHGMALATIAGRGDPRLREMLPLRTPPDDIVLLGVHDLDAGERRAIREAGIHFFTMREIDDRGIQDVADEALALLTRGGRPFHVSFDIDAIDPSHAPGTGTPSPGGLDAREARQLMEKIAQTRRMCSVEMLEVNPLLDHQGRTARLASGLLASALGAETA